MNENTIFIGLYIICIFLLASAILFLYFKGLLFEVIFAIVCIFFIPVALVLRLIAFILDHTWDKEVGGF